MKMGEAARYYDGKVSTKERPFPDVFARASARRQPANGGVQRGG